MKRAARALLVGLIVTLYLAAAAVAVKVLTLPTPTTHLGDR